jgi:hypothetical protein
MDGVFRGRRFALPSATQEEPFRLQEGRVARCRPLSRGTKDLGDLDAAADWQSAIQQIDNLRYWSGSSVGKLGVGIDFFYIVVIFEGVEEFVHGSHGARIAQRHGRDGQ